MGAKFTTLQPAQLCWMEKGLLYIKDMLGETKKIEIKGLDLSFDVDKTDFNIENVLVRIVQNGFIFVLRYDWSWSLIEEESKLLMDFGSAELKGLELCRNYENVGFIKTRHGKYELYLDLSNRRILHAMVDEKVPAGIDIVSEFELAPKLISEKQIDKYFDLPMALYRLNFAAEQLDDQIFIYNKNGVNLGAQLKATRRN